MNGVFLARQPQGPADSEGSGTGRRGAGPRAPRVLAVGGGKGGVGKTMVSVNLGVALAQAGHRTLLLDADFGLANVDVALGLRAAGDLSDVLRGRLTLDDILIDGPAGLRVLPGTSGMPSMAQLTDAERVGLIRAFGELREPVDYLIIDTAPGITEDVLAFMRAAQEVLLVLCDEPTALTDAYALVKVLAQEGGLRRCHVLANRVADAEHGAALFRKLTGVTEKFLDVVLNYAGAVPDDEEVRRAIRRQRSVLEAFPESPAAKALRALVAYLDQWPAASGPRGDLEFFVERVLLASQAE